MRFTVLTWILSCVVTLAVPSASHASIVIIDDFSSGNTFLTITFDPGSTLTDATPAAPDAIGGEREVILTQIDSGQTTASSNPPLGLFSTGNAATASSIVELTYDGVGSMGLNGLMGVDLTGGGTNNSVYADILSNDNGVAFMFTLTDADGTVSSVTRTLLGENVGGEFFLFSDFSAMLDVQAIRSIIVTLTLPQDADVTFNLLEARSSTPTPEPASLALLGGGICSILCGVVARRKRPMTIVKESANDPSRA